MSHTYPLTHTHTCANTHTYTFSLSRWHAQIIMVRLKWMKSERSQQTLDLSAKSLKVGPSAIPSLSLQEFN